MRSRRPASLAPFAPLAAAALLGAAFVPREAAAYCRTISQDIPPGYDPAVEGCFKGDGGAAYELYWKNLCVGYSLQEDGTAKLPLTMVKSVAEQAFGAWSKVTCTDGAGPSIAATELEPAGANGVTCGKVQYNKYGPNQHVVVFRDDGWPYQDSTNTLGLTTVTYDTTSGEIFDADMEINTHDYPIVAFPPARAGAYDLLSVMTHEAGHFLGLAHSGDTSAVMYAYYRAGNTTLQPDDIRGVCAIDPPDGTRATSGGALASEACCTTPRHGFTSACAPVGEDGGIVEPTSATAETVLATSCTGDGASSSDSPASGGCVIGTRPRAPWSVGGDAFVVLAGLALMRRRREHPSLPPHRPPWPRSSPKSSS